MKYFGHQVNASQDARLKRLRKAAGSLGIDLYWRCLELVGDKLNPKNTTCLLEYSLDELAIEVDSTQDLVQMALDSMADLGMCHKVPQSATLCHFYFPKIIKYADKAFRNAFPGAELDRLYATICHNVAQCAPKEVKLKEVESNLKKSKEVPATAPGDIKSPIESTATSSQRPTANELFEEAREKLRKQIKNSND